MKLATSIGDEMNAGWSYFRQVHWKKLKPPADVTESERSC